MDVCRHKGAAPSLGWIENGCINCPYHGWTYDMEGNLVNIPSRPELNGILKVNLVRYECRERAGMIWVSLVDDPWGDPPGLAEWDDPTMHWQSPPFYDWRTSAPRRLENFVDFSHFPFVHENILGTRDKAEVEDHEVWREGQMLRFDRYVVEPNDERMKGILGISDDIVTVLNRYYLTLPGTIYLLPDLPQRQALRALHGLRTDRSGNLPELLAHRVGFRADRRGPVLPDRFRTDGAGPGPTGGRVAVARTPPGSAERRDVHKGG